MIAEKRTTFFLFQFCEVIVVVLLGLCCPYNTHTCYWYRKEKKRKEKKRKEKKRKEKKRKEKKRKEKKGLRVTGTRMSM